MNESINESINQSINQLEKALAVVPPPQGASATRFSPARRPPAIAACKLTNEHAYERTNQQTRRIAILSGGGRPNEA